MPDNDGLKIVVSLDVKKCIERINADLANIEKQIKELEIKATLNKGESLKSINQQIDELNKQKQDLTAELKLNTEKLEKQYSDIQRKNDMSVNIETDKASKQLSGIGGNISNVNNQTMELADSLKSAFANMGLALSTESIFRAIKELAAEATEAVKEYDRMSTNLKIITGKSDVSDMIADYADKSISMGIDVSDYEKSAEVILRAGKSVDESNEFIEKSLMLSKTGFIDAESSAENLLVISNAYDITADKLENVTDALLTLDTTTNSEAGALSEAMAKAAANSQLVGLSYEKLGAMIAKLKDSTGKSESELATSINQILNRTYRVKPNAYTFENENGETEDLTKPLSDVEKITQKMGISIRETASEFKDFEDIISTIAPIWEDLSSVDQNAIASVFGGQHKNVFLNLVNSWNEIQDLTKQAEDSSGATATKYNAYLESIEGKTAKLSTATKELWNNLVPDSTVGNITDATSSLIQFVDEYEVLQNIIKSAAVYGLAKGFISAKTSITGAIGSVKNLSTAFSQLEAVQKSSVGTAEYKNNLKALGTTISTLSDKQIQLVLSTKKLSQNQKIAILEASGLEKAEIKTKLSTLGLSKAQEAAEKSTFNLKSGMSALWNTIKANSVGVLTTAFMLVSSMVSAYKAKQDELIQSAKQSAEETSEYIDSLEGLKDKYLEIVDSENSVSEKTQELNKFKQELVETYGFEKDIIDKLNLSREYGIELLDKEAQKQAQAKRNEFYAQNDKAIKKSVKEFENTHTIVYNGTEGDFNSIPEDIKSMFSKPESSFSFLGGSNELTFKIDATDIYDEYEKINALIVELQNKEKLNLGEQNLLSALETSSKNLKKKIDNYGNTYQTYYEYKAQDRFEDYVNKYGDAANLTGKELESWKDNLYATADGNKVLEESLANLADEYIQLRNAEKEANADDISPDTENISDIGDNVSSLNDKLESYKEKAKSFSSINTVIKQATEEQNTFGRISANTINALHEAGLDGAMSFNEMTGETYFLVDSVDELTRALIDNQNVEIEKSITDTTNAIKRLKEEIKNLGVIDSADDAARASELYKEIAEKETDLSDLNLQKKINASYRFTFETSTDNTVKDAFNKEKSDLDYSFNMDMITQEEYYNQLRQLNEKYYKDKSDFLDEYRQYEVEVYKGLKQIQEEQINSIKEAFSIEKAELDHLKDMNAISQEDYYNKLFDLNEKYFKGKTELLDEYRQYEEEVYKGLKETQIKAIQEQIDALKSVNEEKQEEIDLEKAKQALESAKRNKTISVYDSERGWIRETDRNAIDSAQKEYDDLVLNEKVETLENLIDAIENGTNTNHQLDESINAVEQANSITGQQFIENVMQSFANKGLDFNSMFNTNGLTNGADVYNSIMQGKITPVSSDSYTTNNNNTITLNGVTVMANNPEEFISQMEEVADERFKENFPPAMNQFGRDLQRYKMNHSL